MAGGRLKQAAEELARAQLSPVNCCSHGSYIASPTPVPIWGIAVIVGTSVQEQWDNYYCRLARGPALNGAP